MRQEKELGENSSVDSAVVAVAEMGLPEYVAVVAVAVETDAVAVETDADEDLIVAAETE